MTTQVQTAHRGRSAGAVAVARLVANYSSLTWPHALQSIVTQVGHADNLETTWIARTLFDERVGGLQAPACDRTTGEGPPCWLLKFKLPHPGWGANRLDKAPPSRFLIEAEIVVVWIFVPNTELYYHTLQQDASDRC